MQDARPVTVQQRMASALGGSLVTSLVVTPLDVVKVRLQAQSLVPPIIDTCCGDFVFCTRHLECPPIPIREPRMTGIMDAFGTIVRTEGVAALWRGLGASLVMAVPANVIYFAGYEMLREALAKQRKSRVIEAYAPLFAGAIARAIAAVAVSPLELLKTRLQSSPRGADAGLRHVLSLVSSQGPGVMYRGLGPTLWRDVPFSGLYWLGYDVLTAQFAPLFDATRPRDQFLLSFLCGFASGAAASLVTTPFDVAKTRRQVDVGGGVGGRRQPSTMRVLGKIAAEEGWAGMFRGVTPRVLRTAPACAIMIGSYELGKIYLAAA